MYQPESTMDQHCPLGTHTKLPIILYIFIIYISIFIFVIKIRCFLSLYRRLMTAFHECNYCVFAASLNGMDLGKFNM